MQLVDSIFLGHLSPLAQGAGGLSSSVFFISCIFGMGFVVGLDFLASRSFGEKDIPQCHYWLIQAVYISIFVTAPLMLINVFLYHHLEFFGVTEDVANSARIFLRIINWSMLPFILYVAMRQYLQALGSVKAPVVIIIIANIFNIALNYGLIFGKLGCPQLGIAGSAIATTATRYLLVAGLAIWIFYLDYKHHWGLRLARFKPHWAGQKELVRLGTPAAFQMLFESGAFSISGILVGHLGAIPLAAHYIVLQIASSTFMIPLGLSSSAAVLVGRKVGEDRMAEGREIGNRVLGLTVFVESTLALLIYFFRIPILETFSPNPEVLRLAGVLIILVAIFQIADGLQVVGTGCLRGIGNTKLSSIANFLGYWIVGIPLGAYLCFTLTWGPQGIWIGLTLALFLVSAAVIAGWLVMSRRAVQKPPRPSEI